MRWVVIYFYYVKNTFFNNKFGNERDKFPMRFLLKKK